MGLVLATHGSLLVTAMLARGPGHQPAPGAREQPRDRRRDGHPHAAAPAHPRAGVRRAAVREPGLQPQAGGGRHARSPTPASWPSGAGPQPGSTRPRPSDPARRAAIRRICPALVHRRFHPHTPRVDPSTRAVDRRRHTERTGQSWRPRRPLRRLPRTERAPWGTRPSRRRRTSPQPPAQEAKQVTREAKDQVRQLWSQTRSDLTSQASTQQTRAASGLRELADQLGQMANGTDQDGMARGLVEDVPAVHTTPPSGSTSATRAACSRRRAASPGSGPARSSPSRQESACSPAA